MWTFLRYFPENGVFSSRFCTELHTQSLCDFVRFQIPVGLRGDFDRVALGQAAFDQAQAVVFELSQRQGGR